MYYKILVMSIYPPEPDLSDQEGYEYPEPFVQEPITINDVKQAIKGLHPLKAPGITGIPHLIIQESLSITAPTITRLFQACINQGYHPKEFKQARTIALQKIGKDDYPFAREFWQSRHPCHVAYRETRVTRASMPY
jgi:hypothetical protein